MSRLRRRSYRRPSRRGKLRWFIVLLFLGGLIGINLLLFNPFLSPIHLREQLDAARRSSVLLDRHGKIVTTLNPSRIIWRNLTEIPLALRRAIVAVEDERFYQHRGIDMRGIARALFQNIRYGRRVQGGSTITQQLAKNILLTQEKTFRRKLAEISYAVRIERQYSKEQILEMYLNDIYFGQGAYGVESAAQTYFGRPVQELSLEKIALLVGLPKGPEYYSPFTHPARARQRRNTVLTIMKQHGLINSQLFARLTARPLGTLKQPGVATRGSYFADYVTEQLRAEYGWSERYIFSGGLKIHTTLDLRTQRLAEETLADLPEELPNSMRPQAALIAMDPTTGEIRAMVGGRSYRRSPLNRATVLRRQPGSAIKPIVYAVALKNGYKTNSTIFDEPVVYHINNQSWEPQNNDGQYQGKITLTRALADSVNTVAVKLVHELGVEQVFRMARDLGLPLVESGTRNDRGLAPLALGGLTKGVTPLELTTAYTAFANGGVRSDPVSIIYVEDASGRLLRRGKFRQVQVLPADVSANLTRMMMSVITDGTGKRGDPGRPSAGKTGTTSGNSNAWFVGYTPELLATIWLGNDDNSSLRAEDRMIGSGTAAEFWGRFIQRALAGHPPRNFSFFTTSRLGELVVEASVD